MNLNRFFYVIFFILTSFSFIACKHVNENDDATIPSKYIDITTHLESVKISTAPLENTNQLEVSEFSRLTDNIGLAEYNSLTSHDNFISSPILTSLAGGLLLQSSRSNTQEEIAQWLDIDISNGNNDKIFIPDLASFQTKAAGPYAISLGMWGQSDYLFKKDYLNILSAHYQTDFFAKDFLSDPLTMNSVELPNWVSLKLGDSQILDDFHTYDIDVYTRALFLSILNWHSSWKISNGEPEPLAIENGLWQDETRESQVELPMIKWHGIFSRYDGEGFKAINVPLGNGATSLTVIMPDAGSFSNVESKLDIILDDFEKNSADVEMDFFLPTFEVSSTQDINVPIAGERVYVEHCLDSGDCSTDKSRVLSTSEDYSAINGLGHLYRKSISSKVAFSLNEAGLNNMGISRLHFKATEDEPKYNLFSICSNCSLPFVDPSTNYSGVTFSTCLIVYELAGPTQARPFIFVLRDEMSGIILNIGRITALDGMLVGDNVCAENKIDYEDNIWPLTVE